MSHPGTDATVEASGLSVRPYVGQAHEHQRLDRIGRMELRVLLDGAASGGRLMVVEVRAQRGDASPVHIHGEEDETFVVLEGGMTVWVGDERHHIDPGGIGFLPRNLSHSYFFTADGTRALNICTPSGVENFFRAAGWDLSQRTPDGWAVNPKVLAEIAPHYGVRIIGPPRKES